MQSEFNEYLIIKWEWLEDVLNDEELEQFYEFLERASFDKEEDRYYVVNTKVPYADEVRSIIKNKGYKKPEKPIRITKVQLLNKLRELSKLQDGEIAHIEAVEALLDYINDDEIIDAYSDIPLYFEGLGNE